MLRTVRVALPIPVVKEYTYELPGVLEASVSIGSLVLVPVRSRVYTAIVTELDVEVRPEVTLRRVRAVVSDEPVVNDELLALTHWIARYYLCAWGEALQAALPAGMQTREKVTFYLGSESPAAWKNISGGLYAYMAKHRKATSARLKRVGLRISEEELTKAVKQGALERRVELENPKVRAKMDKFIMLAYAFRTTTALRDLLPQLRGTKQKAVIQELIRCVDSGNTEPLLADVRQNCNAGLQTIKTFEQRGIISIIEKRVFRIPEWMRLAGISPSKAPVFHESQARAVEVLHEAIDTQEYRTYVLHGVTGSGKTEVYLAALEKAFALKQSAIVLVPEIALTPQTVQRFRSRFGDTVAVLHSRMAQGERYDVWEQIRADRYRVVIGPRSAILAPIQNLGLIIVDEEHDGSYKQMDPAPRYHARDVAVMRARMHQAVCILGSATPSLESLANVKQGKYTLLTMPDRAPTQGRSAAALPSIRVIDLCEERDKNELYGALSTPLIQAIGSRLEREEQVILLQNRRGFAPIFECQNCGFVPQCIACSVSMTYHQVKQQLKCHYCGFVRNPPVSCPNCGAAAFAPLGSGTQRVFQDLSELFRDARILRMDRDSTQGKNAHHEILNAFANYEADILIGTQMVAKGLDFGRVTLVGVISCDVGLRLPDFRSEERTFQLLMQVAGRAGRADLPGEVLLQTRRPKHPIFSFLKAHDFDGYAEMLMEERATLGYPPFGRIMGIQVRGAPKRKVERLAEKWRELLLEQLPYTVSVLGPEQPYIERVEHQYRYFLVIKAPKTYRNLHEDVRMVMRMAPSSMPNLHASINVDALEQV
jgi:primosomal protein N' (replication factor Y)